MMAHDSMTSFLNLHQSELLHTSSYLLYQPIGIVPGIRIEPYPLSLVSIRNTTWCHTS
jgi:hypothetical protein